MSVGLRLTHTTHGDGTVRSIAVRPNRATGAHEDYAAVHFPGLGGAGTWSTLVSGRRAGTPTEGGLTVLVRLCDLADGEKWHVAEDYGDLSEMLADIELLPADGSRLAPAEGPAGTTRLIMLARAVEEADLSPDGDPVNVLKFIVDWSVERHMRRVEAIHGRGTRLASARQSSRLAENRSLWTTKLYPQMPEQLRPGAERVLLSVAALLANWFDVEPGAAARLVTASVEARIANLHMRQLRCLALAS